MLPPTATAAAKAAPRADSGAPKRPSSDQPGSCAISTRLVERLGGVVAGVAVLAELADLGGRERLAGHDVTSLIVY